MCMLKLQVGGEHGAVHQLQLQNQLPIQAIDALSLMQPLLEEVSRRLYRMLIVKLLGCLRGGVNRMINSFGFGVL